MPEQELSREPFELKEESFGGRMSLKELKSDPNKIVRRETLVNDSIDDTILFYKDVKNMFEAMKHNYGVNIPDMDMVIGELRQDKKYMFMIVDKIEGSNLNDAKNLPESAKEKFETFYVGILQSVLDAYKENKPFFFDLKPDNIMYGHKSKDENTENDFFLSDVGGGFSYYEDKTADYDKTFFIELRRWVKNIQYYEEKFGKDIALNNMRSKFKEMYEYCKNHKRIQLDEYFTESPLAEKDMDKISK